MWQSSFHDKRGEQNKLLSNMSKGSPQSRPKCDIPPLSKGDQS
jgi:hypothetical protein